MTAPDATPSITIATRESPLALWQAEHVRERLMTAHPNVRVHLLKMTTEGDRRLGSALAEVGGKGLFIKELERALLDGRADLAVHSMKDVPVGFPDGLTLAAILDRADPRDALVSNHVDSLDALPNRARVGTASLRRQAQLAIARPDLQIGLVRGNVGTRLSKLDAGEFDAIVLACAGLQRLGLDARIAQALPPETMLPAIGQGAVGIETRTGDTRVDRLLAPLRCATTTACLTAERAVSEALGGDCTLPLAAYATRHNDQLEMRAFLGLPDGSQQIRWSGRSTVADAARLGLQAAASMRADGADALLSQLRK